MSPLNRRWQTLSFLTMEPIGHRCIYESCCRGALICATPMEGITWYGSSRPNKGTTCCGVGGVCVYLVSLSNNAREYPPPTNRHSLSFPSHSNVDDEHNSLLALSLSRCFHFTCSTVMENRCPSFRRTRPNEILHH